MSSPRTLVPQARDQRGAVLPLVMLSLLVLSGLLISLSTLTGQEPIIAANHVMMVQAQALAEAGIERALWALNNPESPEGVRPSVAAPAPYDGSQLIRVSTEAGWLGGFHLTINGAATDQRRALAVGLVPADQGPMGRARQEISATLIRLRFPATPAGIAVRADLTIGDGVTVDTRGDGSCGDLAATWSTGTTTLGAGSRLLGRDGDPTTANESTDVRQQQPAFDFDDLAFSPAELNTLKAVARAQGTYFRGSTTFDASHRLPDGLVFVDTAGGQPITEATPDASLSIVSITDGAAGPGGTFRGWIIVNGSLSVTGNVSLQGLAYAADRFTHTGSASISGAAIAGHVRSATPSIIDARPAGGPALVWNCDTARTGAGTIPRRWMVKPGSYREAAG